MDLQFDSASAIRDRVCSGAVRAADVARASLERIERLEPRLHSFLKLTPELAMRQAADVDRRLASGETPGPLAGVPVALKDVLNVEGIETTCGSRYLENYRSPYSATVVERLMDAGALIVGKTNTDEFAMGSSTENSAFGMTVNPWDKTRVPGGSSGGSAAAVAARLVPVSLGSDTGGSVRQPAGLCGVVGLKPTYGRVSRYGLVAYASSLDQIGPFANTVADAACVLAVIGGADARDATCLDQPAPDYGAGLRTGDARADLKGVRCGVPREYLDDGLSPAVRERFDAAVDVFRRQGAEIRDVSLPMTQYAVAVYYIVATAEASSNLARYDAMHYGHRTDVKAGLIETVSASRADSLGDEVRRRILLGTYVLCSGYRDAYYLKALKVRTRIRADFDAAFVECDVLLNPVTSEPAFPVGSRTADPLSMYLSDIYTISANLAGVPSMSVPAGFVEEDGSRLPVGLMLTAKPFDEAMLFRTGDAYQAVTDWHNQAPPGWA